METDRVLRLEQWIGSALILCWGVWALFHWHSPANKVTDFFVILAALGAAMIVRVQFKFLRQHSN
jgi:hypothetical protein